MARTLVYTRQAPVAGAAAPLHLVDLGLDAPLESSALPASPAVPAFPAGPASSAVPAPPAVPASRAAGGCRMALADTARSLRRTHDSLHRTRPLTGRADTDEAVAATIAAFARAVRAIVDRKRPAGPAGRDYAIAPVTRTATPEEAVAGGIAALQRLGIRARLYSDELPRAHGPLGELLWEFGAHCDALSERLQPARHRMAEALDGLARHPHAGRRLRGRLRGPARPRTLPGRAPAAPPGAGRARRAGHAGVRRRRSRPRPPGGQPQPAPRRARRTTYITYRLDRIRA